MSCVDLLSGTFSEQAIHFFGNAGYSGYSNSWNLSGLGETR
jgi:hypothetical protein